MAGSPVPWEPIHVLSAPDRGTSKRGKSKWNIEKYKILISPVRARGKTERGHTNLLSRFIRVRCGAYRCPRVCLRRSHLIMAVAEYSSVGLFTFSSRETTACGRYRPSGTTGLADGGTRSYLQSIPRLSGCFPEKKQRTHLLLTARRDPTIASDRFRGFRARLLPSDVPLFSRRPVPLTRFLPSFLPRLQRQRRRRRRRAT